MSILIMWAMLAIVSMALSVIISYTNVTALAIVLVLLGVVLGILIAELVEGS